MDKNQETGALRAFTRWHGDYEKEYYDVLLPDGRVVLCWPNAGKMVPVDGKTRGEWSPSEVTGVRINRG